MLLPSSLLKRLHRRREIVYWEHIVCPSQMNISSGKKREELGYRRERHAIPLLTHTGDRVSCQSVWKMLNWKWDGKLCRNQISEWRGCRSHTLQSHERSPVQLPTNGCHVSRRSSEHPWHRLSEFQPPLAALWWIRCRTVSVSRRTQIIKWILKPNLHKLLQINSVKLMLDFDAHDVETLTMAIEKQTVTS